MDRVGSLQPIWCQRRTVNGNCSCYDGSWRLIDNTRHDFFRFAFALTFAHLARCAVAILLRPAADMVCRLPRTFRDFVPSR